MHVRPHILQESRLQDSSILDVNVQISCIILAYFCKSCKMCTKNVRFLARSCKKMVQICKQDYYFLQEILQDYFSCKITISCKKSCKIILSCKKSCKACNSCKKSCKIFNILQEISKDFYVLQEIWILQDTLQ